MTGSEDRDDVGSVSEEAMKLFAALSGWAQETGGAYAGAADSTSATFRAINEHLATGGEDCRYCPVCRMISVARATSPEVRSHLTAAATSLFQAAAAAMATPSGSPRSEEPVERIDLSDDWPEEPAEEPAEDPFGDDAPR